MNQGNTEKVTPILWLEDQPITAEMCMRAIRTNGELKTLVRELMIEKIVDAVHLKEEEEAQLIKARQEKKGLTDKKKYEQYLAQQQVSEDIDHDLITRPKKLALLREERWGPRANSLYLKHKDRYDVVKYWMIRSKNENVMQEAYFRLKEGEETWEKLSQGLQNIEENGAFTIGPVSVSNSNPELVKLLKDTGKGKITKPTKLEGHIIIAELIEIQSMMLDASIREKIMRDEFKTWLDDECSKAMEKMRFEN